MKTGDKFGRLTVLCDGPNYKIVCKCDCGSNAVIRKYDLLSTSTTSCGCAQADAARKAQTKHGLRHSKSYDVWAGMIARCTNKNHVGYKNYGGRGITVCKDWVSFTKFYNDMGDSNGLTLERVDNTKGYSKNNCKWVSRKDQCNNTRHNVNILFNNKTQSLMLWADELKIPYHRLQGRRRLGWSIERMLTTP